MATNGGGSVSLEGALRTCKVDTAWDTRIQSDRFFNPDNMVCPIWNGVDTAGRRVCPDSFYTKRAGCNSAEDRVIVENNLRPQYNEYINLDAAGLAGQIYGASNQGDPKVYGETAPFINTGRTNRALKAMQPGGGQDGLGVTGNWGLESGLPQTFPGCLGMGSGAPGAPTAYQQAMAQESQAARQAQALQEGYKNHQFRQRSGF